MEQQEPVGPSPEQNSSPSPSYPRPMSETKTPKRSTASSLIGLVYTVYFGFGLISSSLGLIGALVSWAEHLQQPLAIEILEGKFAPGDTVQVDVSDNFESLSFTNPNEKKEEAAE